MAPLNPLFSALALILRRAHFITSHMFYVIFNIILQEGKSLEDTLQQVQDERSEN
jgi:hypothetical protein